MGAWGIKALERDEGLDVLDILKNEYVPEHPVMDLGEMIELMKEEVMLGSDFSQIDFLFDNTAMALAELYFQWKDIISLPHPTSAKHPRMPLSDRAAQFAPFAALSDHSAALAETARLTDQRMELDKDARAALDLKQQLLLERIKERPEITVTWFQPDAKKDGGRYIVSTGRLKRIHEADQVLILADGLRIPIGDIVELESECIRGLL